jgi:osomolarity two-component system sensor histidine kinase CHK1
LPPTVVDLLVKQMLKLSDDTRTAMMLASCIGAERISLRTLATAAGKRIEETANDLWGALDADGRKLQGPPGVGRIENGEA